MKVFLDTPSLFKLYHREADSAMVENVFTQNTITDVFLSEICKLEFASTVWKKVRTQEITAVQATAVTEAFEKDFGKYTFVQVDAILIEQARNLLTFYGRQGLRTLDSIQLSTAILIRNRADLFLCADKLLKTFFVAELLPVENSNH